MAVYLSFQLTGFSYILTSHVQISYQLSAYDIICSHLVFAGVTFYRRTFDSRVTYADECQLPSFAIMSLSALIQTSVRKRRYAFASTSTAHARKECSHSTFPFTACILELNFNFDRSGKRKILPLWNRMKPFRMGLFIPNEGLLWSLKWILIGMLGLPTELHWGDGWQEDAGQPEQQLLLHSFSIPSAGRSCCRCFSFFLPHTSQALQLFAVTLQYSWGFFCNKNATPPISPTEINRVLSKVSSYLKRPV